jgi:hypothetical protein
MRVLLFAFVALVAACASGGGDNAEPTSAPSPFPVQRGTAMPPPAANAPAGQTAPPEGRAPGGIDFGQWRGADPATYGPAFQTQLRQRYQGRSEAQVRADLEVNGFACRESSGRLECRIEIMERQCGIAWYAVLERNRPEVAAGHDVMCLGAR